MALSAAGTNFNLTVRGSLLTPGIPKSTLAFSITNAQASFFFTEFEVPSHLDSLGVDEISVVHQFPGGKRTIQTFGETPPKEIQWEGTIFGPDSFSRVNQLRAMVTNKEAVLTYGPYRFQGLLKHIRPKPGFEGYIPYSAMFEPTLEVSLKPLGTVQPQQTPTVTISLSLQELFVQANLAITNATGFPLVSVATTLLAVGSEIAAATRNPTGPSASSNVNGGADAVRQLTQANTILFAYLSNTLNMDDALLAFPLYIAANALLTALSYIAPTNVLYLTVDSPCLFVLAASYLGDPGLWGIIARANGGLPPFNKGLVTVAIPL